MLNYKFNSLPMVAKMVRGSTVNQLKVAIYGFANDWIFYTAHIKISWTLNIQQFFFRYLQLYLKHSAEQKSSKLNLLVQWFWLTMCRIIYISKRDERELFTEKADIAIYLPLDTFFSFVDVIFFLSLEKKMAYNSTHFNAVLHLLFIIQITTPL